MGPNQASRLLSKKERNEAVKLMNSADCDLWLPGGCGPREWFKMPKVLGPQYQLKIYEFKKGAPRLELIPIYKGTAFTFLIYMWLIVSVSTAIISTWTSPVSDVDP